MVRGPRRAHRRLRLIFRAPRANVHPLAESSAGRRARAITTTIRSCRRIAPHENAGRQAGLRADDREFVSSRPSPGVSLRGWDRHTARDWIRTSTSIIGHKHLKLARLPIPPPGRGRRSLPSAWRASMKPTAPPVSPRRPRRFAENPLRFRRRLPSDPHPLRLARGAIAVVHSPPKTSRSRATSWKHGANARIDLLRSLIPTDDDVVWHGR